MSNEHYKNMQSVYKFELYNPQTVRYQQLRTQARLQMKGPGKIDDTLSGSGEKFLWIQNNLCKTISVKHYVR
jgi:hypothetical protein